MAAGCALFTYRHGRLVRRASEKPKSARQSTQTAHTAACCSGASANPLRPKAAAMIARKKKSSPEVSIVFLRYSKDPSRCAKCMPHAETTVRQGGHAGRARASLDHPAEQPAGRPVRAQARRVAAASVRRRARAAAALPGALRPGGVHRLGPPPHRGEELRLKP